MAWFVQSGRWMLSEDSQTESAEAKGRSVEGEIECHRDYLLHTALGRLRNWEQAEDAVQETFLAALASDRNFSGHSSRRTWLTAILYHKIYDQLRRTCRNRALFQDRPMHDGEWELVAPASGGWHFRNPRTELELKEFREAFTEAMLKLPPRMARVYELYESEACSSSKICEMFQISEPNLWIILHRTRKRLREILSAWHPKKLREQKTTRDRRNRNGS
ncbi:MAG TPA: sigma-70 family RNA polymerase sigma factor [Chthoniobacterales bacterium]